MEEALAHKSEIDHVHEEVYMAKGYTDSQYIGQAVEDTGMYFIYGGASMLLFGIFLVVLGKKLKKKK